MGLITKDINGLTDASIELVMIGYKAKFAWMNWPIIGPIAAFAVQQIITFLFSFPKFWAYTVAVILTVRSQRIDFDEAITAYEQAMSTGSNDDKKNADDKLDAAADNLIIVRQP